MSGLEVTQVAEDLVKRLNQGDRSAFDELLRVSQTRMEHLTRKLLGQFPRVRRWEQTEDVYQLAAIRLQQALASVQIVDGRHFLRLMALQIRRELIDLARRHSGPQGHASHYQTHCPAPGSEREDAPAWAEATAGDDPQATAEWTEFHEKVDGLSEELRELFDLIYYNGMSQLEVAELLGVSDRTIRRRWRDAKLELGRLLPPGLSEEE